MHQHDRLAGFVMKFSSEIGALAPPVHADPLGRVLFTSSVLKRVPCPLSRGHNERVTAVRHLSKHALCNSRYGVKAACIFMPRKSLKAIHYPQSSGYDVNEWTIMPTLNHLRKLHDTISSRIELGPSVNIPAPTVHRP